jgi:hypothetical protein
MPLDSRIPLGVNPINIQPVQQSLRDAMTMREASDRMQDNALDRQEKVRKLKEEADIREALRSTGGDLELALPAIRRISPTYALGVENTIDEQKKRKVASQNSALEQNARVMGHIGQVFNSVRDQATYDAAVATINQIHDANKIPRVPFPPTYDAKTVEGYRQQALTVAQQIENARRADNDRYGNGEYGNALQRRELELGRHLGPDEEMAFRREWLDRQSNGTGAATQAQKATAERWKAERLAKLEEDATPGYGKAVMSDQAREAAKLQIENSYRAQIGMPPLAALPPAWNAWKPGTGQPAPAAQPAAPPTAAAPPTLQGAVQSPAAPPAPAPAAPPAAAAPSPAGPGSSPGWSQGPPPDTSMPSFRDDWPTPPAAPPRSDINLPREAGPAVEAPPPVIPAEAPRVLAPAVRPDIPPDQGGAAPPPPLTANAGPESGPPPAAAPAPRSGTSLPPLQEAEALIKLYQQEKDPAKKRRLKARMRALRGKV